MTYTAASLQGDEEDASASLSGNSYVVQLYIQFERENKFVPSLLLGLKRQQASTIWKQHVPF